MAQKPPFREADEIPKRGDDIKITFPFNLGSVEASGRTVVGIILVISAIGFLFWHDYQTEQAHERTNRTMQTVICVLTLNEQERREYRISGQYCSTSLYTPHGSGFRYQARRTPTP